MRKMREEGRGYGGGEKFSRSRFALTELDPDRAGGAAAPAALPWLRLPPSGDAPSGGAADASFEALCSRLLARGAPDWCRDTPDELGARGEPSRARNPDPDPEAKMEALSAAVSPERLGIPRALQDSRSPDSDLEALAGIGSILVVGEGRSRFAAGLAIEWGYHWLDSGWLVTELRSSFAGRGPSELEILDRQIRRAGLVVSEVDAAASSYGLSTLDTLIRRRQGDGRPTIVTCGVSYRVLARRSPSLAARLASFVRVEA